MTSSPFPRRRRIQLLGLAVMIAAPIALVGCGSASQADVEALVKKSWPASSGEISSVSCQGTLEAKQGATQQCTVTATNEGGTGTFEVTLTADRVDGSDIYPSIANSAVTMDKGFLDATLISSIDGAESIDCEAGVDVPAGSEGETVSCAATGTTADGTSAEGTYEVTVTPDGKFSATPVE